MKRLGLTPLLVLAAIAVALMVAARFSPVFPGETLLLEVWDEPQGTRFRCRTRERAVVALDHGVLNSSW